MHSYTYRHALLKADHALQPCSEMFFKHLFLPYWILVHCLHLPPPPPLFFFLILVSSSLPRAHMCTETHTHKHTHAKVKLCPSQHYWKQFNSAHNLRLYCASYISIILSGYLPECRLFSWKFCTGSPQVSVSSSLEHSCPAPKQHRCQRFETHAETQQATWTITDNNDDEY